MKQLAKVGIWLLVGLAGLCGRAAADEARQQSFSRLVGPVKVGDVADTGVQKLPFLTWGGDVATFHANGGLKTKSGSIFDKLGLKVELTSGDDFVAQVRDYVSGKTPYLRGTMSQLGQASEVLNAEAGTKPVVFLQLTWSKGDHMVIRVNCKTLNDFKLLKEELERKGEKLGGKKKIKIALQSGGPHVGMLDDVLKTAGLVWQDVEIVWTKDVTGKDSPAELFRKDASVDACFVITPDMQGLTGGLDREGTGADNTVKGAHVLVSTVTMKRSIADVYACRKDFYDRHKETVEKVAAGYLKGCEDLLDVKTRAANKDRRAAVRYEKILQLAQKIYGKEVLENSAEADKFISDAQFVGLPGNRAFLKDAGNLSGFAPRMESALRMAVREGWASRRASLLAADFDYRGLKRLGNLDADPNQGRVAPPPPSKDKAIYSFVISFDVNQTEFPEKEYGADFQRALELASLFGNSAIEVRGHSDPNELLRNFVRASIFNRTLRREGERGKFRYFLTSDNSELDLDDARTLKKIAELIRKENYDKAPVNPQVTLNECDKLSEERARQVFAAVFKYASSKKLVLVPDQMKPKGISVFEPLVPRPRNDRESAKNRRVEFRIYKLKDQARAKAESKDYDY